MALADDLEQEVVTLFANQWTVREGRKVPEASEVQLGNNAVTLDGAVLYADLADSTEMVNTYPASFAAEVYKAYLYCAAKVITQNGGSITSYDGDRIMAVFIGDGKESAAAKAALQIKYCVVGIINPKLHTQYPRYSTFEVQQAVGVDTSSLFVARTGIRGSNDLVWVGRAANYAAKLCELRTGAYSSWITEDVYTRLNSSSKVSSGTDMWEKRVWTTRNINVYRSSYKWKP